MAKATSSSEFVSALADHLRSRFGGRVFVEKSPTNVYCFDRLAKAMPAIRTVHLIRDGRDVAVSLMGRGFNLFSAGSRWLCDTVAGVSARRQAGHLEIRYEALVADPAVTLNSVFRHLGVDDCDVVSGHTPAKPGLYMENWSSRAEPSSWQQTPGDPISARSVGRYRDTLSQSDLALLYRIRLRRPSHPDLPCTFGDLLEFLGYTTGARPPSLRPSFRRRVTEEGKDYWRRFNRFTGRRQLQLPTRYTRIDSSR